MAMSARHRDILREKRIELINNIKNIKAPFFDYFMRDRTLTEEMIAEITEPPIYTTRERVAKLLDRLPSRGANAFAILVEALYETEQEHLAKLLDPTVNWPLSDETDSAQIAEISTEFIVDQIERRTPLKVQITNNPKCMEQRGKYSTTHSANCKALIVSVCNEQASRGLEEDRTMVDTLFKGLNFTVQHLDVMAKNLDTKLCEESSKLAETNLEALALFILRCPGHVNDRYIADRFNGKKCKALIGKPKLIFLQICETPVPQIHAGAGDAQAGTGNTNTSKAAVDMSAFLIVQIYDKADENQRSLAVTGLCYTFAEVARHYSIIDLLARSKFVISKLKKIRKLAETSAEMEIYSTIEAFFFYVTQQKPEVRR